MFKDVDHWTTVIGFSGTNNELGVSQDTEIKKEQVECTRGEGLERRKVVAKRAPLLDHECVSTDALTDTESAIVRGVQIREI